jgi:hypothetical protein
VRDRIKLYAGVYTAPDPAARDELDRLNVQCGMTAFKLGPYRVDRHRHRWGEVACARRAHQCGGVSDRPAAISSCADRSGTSERSGGSDTPEG